MALTTSKRFDFTSWAVAPDTFAVVCFKGTEGFSRCYEFEIMLVAADPEIDLDKILGSPASFTILRKQGHIPFHGILSRFEQLHAVDEYIFYRAVLAPRLWWLDLTRHNQVFLDRTVPEIIQEVLKDGGLTTLDFELRLRKNYPQWEYVCQYRESHLDFASRWMEREGMYFYFEQNQEGEKVIITDTRIAHSEMDHGKTMYYSPPSGLDEPHREEVIKTFICTQKMLPKNVRLKDYNYRMPSLEVSGNAPVKNNGRGDIYIYGEHFRTPEEGNALARIRAEELLCQEKRFYGESTIPFLRPGYLFELQDHYRSDFNQGYLTIELQHEGSQAAFLLAGIQKGLSEVEKQPYYRNSFAAILGSVQFRPERKTEKARFYGTMNAKIDAAGSGQYAELDDEGRYKVVLPFDLSGRKNGKGSAWLRMAQPYAGTDHGMHFPLHKGTEVLLTFIDGDPDRPIIQGAVPNAETASQVTASDQTMSKITTAGGNKIHMEDQEGRQRVLMQTPTANSWMRMGAPNDPGDEKDEKKRDGLEEKDDGFWFSTEGSWNQKVHQNMSIEIGGNSTSIVEGGEEKIIAGFDNKTVVGAKTDIVVLLCLALELAAKGSFGPHGWTIRGSHERVHATEMKAVAEDIEGIGTRLQAAEDDIEAHGQTIEAHGTRITASESDIGAHANWIEATESSIEAYLDKLEAHETQITAQGNKIQAVGTAVTTLGSELQAAGQTMRENGISVTSSGTKIEQAGLHLRQAGLILDN